MVSKNFVRTILVMIMIISLCTVTVYSRSAPDNKKISVRSSFDVEYTLTMSMKNYSIEIVAINHNREEVPSAFAVYVDGQVLNHTNFTIAANDKRQFKLQGTNGINVINDIHEVRLSTIGTSANFTFHEEINESSTTRFPKIHIENVSVVNGTWEGEPSAYLEVELENPSRQTYSAVMLVHTLESDGHSSGGAVRKESNRTVLIPLEEDPGERVAGEVRLFTADTPATQEGALDMVEFVGRAGESTTVWKQSYEPITPPWEDNAYRYHNASLQENEYTLPVDPTEPSPILLGGLALLGLLVIRKLI